MALSLFFFHFSYTDNGRVDLKTSDMAPVYIWTGYVPRVRSRTGNRARARKNSTRGRADRCCVLTCRYRRTDTAWKRNVLFSYFRFVFKHVRRTRSTVRTRNADFPPENGGGGGEREGKNKNWRRQATPCENRSGNVKTDCCAAVLNSTTRWTGARNTGTPTGD